MEIRPVILDDAEQIAAIYAPIVEHTSISFEERAPSVSEMRERIRSNTITYPWLVATSGDDVLGYAYASAHMDRAGYRWSVNSSIYVREDARGRGTGKTLYAELFRLLEQRRFHAVFAGIALPNDASIALHRSLGFALVGIYREVGFKFGAWFDTSWWQRRLSAEPRDDRPSRPSEGTR
ncbi:MAG TPA: arsinothricin resistance N-acetyltransferase ArsN1 family B [Candidatus Eremiobacteraceae bacterium]|nr:arsinothricin resistance N-acetyltransferase ArsN1 family B [Candidatus Eremiobacteraceae bacterium]